MSWEKVNDGIPSDRIRRFPVPGGWLYQVVREDFIGQPDPNHLDTREIGWHPPVFVSDGSLR